MFRDRDVPGRGGEVERRVGQQLVVRRGERELLVRRAAIGARPEQNAGPARAEEQHTVAREQQLRIDGPRGDAPLGSYMRPARRYAPREIHAAHAAIRP